MYMYMLTLDRINLHTDEKWLQNIVINFWIQQKLLIFCYHFRSLLEDSADEIEIDIPSTKVLIQFSSQNYV